MICDDLLNIGGSLVSAERPLSRGTEDEDQDCVLHGTRSSGETRISSPILPVSVLLVSCVSRRLLRFLHRICPFSVLTTYDLGLTSSKAKQLSCNSSSHLPLSQCHSFITLAAFLLVRVCLLCLLESILFLS